MDSPIARNLERVREQMARAAERAGRAAEEITLVAVSKTRTAEEIAAAAQAGVSHFGENYVQELVAKREALGEVGEAIHWHFIGHLQTNKARFLTSFCALIESVDSIRLAEEINKRAGASGRVQPVLLQLDLAGEPTKYGCPEADIMRLAECLISLPHVAWEGLMIIPPLANDPEASRPYFRRLRAWRERLAREFPEQNLRHLSMGMSADFEIAIEEGATIVRIGTAIFGPRS